MVKSYGYSGEINIIVMELLGKSLEYLFQEKGNRFSVKTVCLIGIQMVIIKINHIVGSSRICT